MAVLHQSVPAITILGILIAAGCQQQAEIAPRQDTFESAAVPEPAPVPAITSVQSACEWELPNHDRSLPKFIRTRASGAPFDVREWLEHWNAVPTNAECLYLKAMADVSDLIERRTDAPEQRKRSTVLRGMIEGLCPQDAPLASEITPERARTVRNAGRHALIFMDQAQQEPTCVFSHKLDLRQELTPPHFVAASLLVRLGAIELRALRDSEDLDPVVSSFHRGLRMSRDLRPRGQALHQLLADRLERVVLGTLESDILSRPDLTAEHCSRLIAVLRDHESALIDPLVEMVKVEYVLVGEPIYQLESGEIGPEFWEREPDFLNQIDFDKEWDALNELTRVLLDYVKRPYSEQLKHDEYLAFREKSSTDATWGILFREIVPDYRLLRFAIAKTQVHRSAAAARLRFRRFQLQQGRDPESLAEAFGSDPVPLDPFSGEPLRFRATETEFLVYSIGRDQVDDGAEKDWDRGHQPGDFIFRLPRIAAPIGVDQPPR